MKIIVDRTVRVAASQTLRFAERLEHALVPLGQRWTSFGATLRRARARFLAGLLSPTEGRAPSAAHGAYDILRRPILGKIEGDPYGR